MRWDIKRIRPGQTANKIRHTRQGHHRAVDTRPLLSARQKYRPQRPDTKQRFAIEEGGLDFSQTY